MLGIVCRRFRFFLTSSRSRSPLPSAPQFFCSPQVLARVLDLSARKKEKKRLLRRLLFSAHLLSEHKTQKTKNKSSCVWWLLDAQNAENDRHLHHEIVKLSTMSLIQLLRATLLKHNEMILRAMLHPIGIVVPYPNHFYFNYQNQCTKVIIFFLSPPDSPNVLQL